MVTKDKSYEIARTARWLSDQSPKFQEDLLSRCHLRSYREKEALHHAGDPCSGVFALVSGVIKIELAAPGGEYRITSIKQPPFWFGEGACFRRTGYAVTVTASTPVFVLHLPQHEFERMVENPSHCRSFALLSQDHLDEALQILGHMLIGDVTSRVAARLALLAEHAGPGRPAVVPVTQADLAEMCGLSRPTVQQVLAGLERQGLVRPGYRKIEIAAPERLLERSAERPDNAPVLPGL